MTDAVPCHGSTIRRIAALDGGHADTLDQLTDQLAAARRCFSSRLAPPPTPAISVLIHAAVLVIWVALFLLAFGQGGVFAWSVGLAYLAYDAALLAFTA